MHDLNVDSFKIITSQHSKFASVEGSVDKKAASVCKNWTQMRWKIKEVRYYFDYLNCLSSIRPEGVGTLV